MFWIVFICLLRGSSAVIYSLNDTEYAKLPALYALDDYGRCLTEPGGTYCVADFHLFAEDSQLMRVIQEYSDNKMKHFNHTEIHRGVCVTSKTCVNFTHRTLNTSLSLYSTLEACVNGTMWRDYSLQARLIGVNYCKRAEEKMVLDSSDIVMAAVYLILIMLNVFGSLYDEMFCNEDGKRTGNPYLLAFSLRRNWSKLTASGSGGRDPRMERLKLFHALRTMTMICVIFSHTTLITAFSYIANPLYIEKAYEDPLKQILFNGSLVTHTFFVMSSFLLAYNIQVLREKQEVGWWHVPKGMLMRFLRLIPSYVLVLGTIASLMRHLGSAPLWELVVGSEARACRHYWWAHALFLNNYLYDDAHCLPQTWYLAADTQLFFVGLLVCVAAKSVRAQKIALSLLFFVSLLIPALHTYLQDLDAVVIQSPESYRNLYATNNTFRLLYIRGHTNLSTYTLGLAGGFLTYYWQKEGKNLDKYKNFRIIFWMTFPAGLAIILSGGIFYTDGTEPSTWLRIMYATIYKPLFQLCVVMFIIGVIFKFETVYRGILEWRGFTWTGRVSYEAFLLHSLFQRGVVGTQTQPVYMSDYYVIMLLCASLFISFMMAAVLWLAVDAPASNIVKTITQPRTRNNADKA